MSLDSVTSISHITKWYKQKLCKIIYISQCNVQLYQVPLYDPCFYIENLQKHLFKLFLVSCEG